jgi:hypothetical protein
MHESTETAAIHHAGTETLKTKRGSIPGYDYGTSRATHSPVTLDDLRALECKHPITCHCGI